MELAKLICAVIDTSLILLTGFLAIAGIFVGAFKLAKHCRQVAAFLWVHRRDVGLISLLLVSLGAMAYAHSVRIEQENDKIREIVFRAALTHYVSLVPPKPNTLYVLYQSDSDPVSPVLLQHLHASFPQVITGGDPEFHNSSQCRNFEIGDIEYYGPNQVSTSVNSNIRGMPSKGTGLTNYTLHRSGESWIITKVTQDNEEGVPGIKITASAVWRPDAR